MPKKLYIVTQSVFNIQHFVSVTYTALLQFDVGVRNLIKERKNIFFVAFTRVKARHFVLLFLFEKAITLAACFSFFPKIFCCAKYFREPFLYPLFNKRFELNDFYCDLYFLLYFISYGKIGYIKYKRILCFQLITLFGLL